MMMDDFDILWLGQTASAIGSAVTAFALPTVAIFILHATPLQIGAISALGLLPFPVLGMLIGVLADRLPRRYILIAADMLRFTALVTIPVAAYFGALSINQLYAVALVSGVGSAFFAITYQSYLPTLVPSQHLTTANAKLEFSNSGSEIVGTAIGGALVQWLGPALTVALDAASYLASVLTLALIRTKEKRIHGPSLTVQQLLIEVREGIDCVFGFSDLRCIVAATATANFGGAIAGSMTLLYAYRVLHLQPGILGVILGFAAFGFVGALLSGSIRALYGLRTTLVSSLVLLACGMALPLLAQFGAAYVVLFASSAIAAIAGPIYNINQLSYRQALVDSRLQGRVNATVRTLVWGILPVGSIVGGLLGNIAGIQPTIAVGAAISVTGALWLAPMREREPLVKTTET